MKHIPHSLLIFPALLCTALAADLSSDVYPGIRDSNGALIPSVTSYLGKEISFFDEPVQTQLIKRRNNFGYSAEEIQKYFSIPLHMPLDETGLDRSSSTRNPSAHNL
jgi:hypothetical protein